MPDFERAHEVGEALRRRLWAGGVSDPLTAIEQVSYLILLRTLELRTGESPEGPVARAFEDTPFLRWDLLRSLPDNQMPELLDQRLIPFLVEAVDSKRFAVAMRGATLGLTEADLVGDCVEAIDRLEVGDAGRASAEIYDILLDQLLLSAGSAQLRTPQPLVEVMVDLADPQPGQVICDPAAGTGALLVEADRRVRGRADGPIGYDLNASMVRLGLINMLLHDIPDPEMVYEDTLSRGFEWPAVDVVISHPPFGGSFDHRDLSPDLELTSGRTDILFLELCRRLLRLRGRAVLLMPEGVLFGLSQDQIEARRRWLTQGGVEAVVSLAPEILGPQVNVEVAILLLGARDGTEQVCFGQIDSGLELPPVLAGQKPVELLPHLAAAVRWRLEGGNGTAEAQALGQTMWIASIDEIGEQGWSLAPSSYRRFDDPSPDDEGPAKLLDEVEELEDRIRDELGAVRASLENRR